MRVLLVLLGVVSIGCTVTTRIEPTMPPATTGAELGGAAPVVAQTAAPPERERASGKECRFHFMLYGLPIPITSYRNGNVESAVRKLAEERKAETLRDITYVHTFTSFILVAQECVAFEGTPGPFAK